MGNAKVLFLPTIADFGKSSSRLLVKKSLHERLLVGQLPTREIARHQAIEIPQGIENRPSCTDSVPETIFLPTGSTQISQKTIYLLKMDVQQMRASRQTVLSETGHLQVRTSLCALHQAPCRLLPQNSKKKSLSQVMLLFAISVGESPGGQRRSRNIVSTPKKISQERNGHNRFHRKAMDDCFSAPVDSILDDFDFEKNLALFDKQAVFEEIETLGYPKIVRPNSANQPAKYKCDQNVLQSTPVIYRQITVPSSGTRVYVTGEFDAQQKRTGMPFFLLFSLLYVPNPTPHCAWKRERESNWVGKPVCRDRPICFRPMSDCASYNLMLHTFSAQHWKKKNKKTHCLMPTGLWMSLFCCKCRFRSHRTFHFLRAEEQSIRSRRTKGNVHREAAWDDGSLCKWNGFAAYWWKPQVSDNYWLLLSLFGLKKKKECWPGLLFLSDPLVGSDDVQQIPLEWSSARRKWTKLAWDRFAVSNVSFHFLSRRMTPKNSHQNPRVVVMCGPHIQGAQGVNCARQLVMHGLNVTLFIPNFMKVLSELQTELDLFSLTSSTKVAFAKGKILCKLWSHSEVIPYQLTLYSRRWWPPG